MFHPRLRAVCVYTRPATARGVSGRPGWRPVRDVLKRAGGGHGRPAGTAPPGLVALIMPPAWRRSSRFVSPRAASFVSALTASGAEPNLFAAPGILPAAFPRQFSSPSFVSKRASFWPMRRSPLGFRRTRLCASRRARLRTTYTARQFNSRSLRWWRCGEQFVWAETTPRVLRRSILRRRVRRRIRPWRSPPAVASRGINSDYGRRPLLCWQPSPGAGGGASAAAAPCCP